MISYEEETLKISLKSVHTSRNWIWKKTGSRMKCGRIISLLPVVRRKLLLLNLYCWNTSFDVLAFCN